MDLPRGQLGAMRSYGHQVFSAAESAPAPPNENTMVARLELIL